MESWQLLKIELKLQPLLMAVAIVMMMKKKALVKRLLKKMEMDEVEVVVVDLLEVDNGA
jgi:hypothetical protein